MIESIQELLQKEAQAVLNIPVTDAYERAVELIVEQIHRRKGKLVTSGMGKAGQIAMNIATTFCSTGIPSVFLHPSEAQHGDLGILQEKHHYQQTDGYDCLDPLVHFSNLFLDQTEDHSDQNEQHGDGCCTAVSICHTCIFQSGTYESTCHHIGKGCDN